VNNAMNINQIGGLTSNYRLRGEPVKLNAKEFRGFYKPDGDGYEEVWHETSSAEKLRDKMRLRGSRKQLAARQMVPRSSVTIVKTGEPVAPKVAIAKLEGKSEQDVRIIELEEKIRTLIGA